MTPSLSQVSSLLVKWTYNEILEAFNHKPDACGSMGMKLVRTDQSKPDYIGGFINYGNVAYEVKTYNPSNSPAVLFDTFKEGMRQTIERASLKHMNAVILVFDKAAFDNLRNSTYGPQVIRMFNDMSKYKKNGTQAVFMMLENDLWGSANRSLHAIQDVIKVM